MLRFSPTFVLAIPLIIMGCGPKKKETPQAQTSSKASADANQAPNETEKQMEGAKKPIPKQKDLAATAHAIAHRVIVLDGHIDVPYRLGGSLNNKGKPTENVGEATEKGDFDYPRAKKGGLDAPFMSIYVPAEYETTGGSKAYAERMINLVEEIVAKHPNKFALAPSVAKLRQNFAAGKISLPMGMENGSPIEGDLKNVKYFYDRGIRYITLTHGKNNHIADSSYDDKKTHNGLSAFGRKLVPEMNRVGIMVDISHVSDDTFWQVIEQSKTPVIASHSSCRHFTPNFERNMSDKMIKALAEKDGVIQINFGSAFISDTYRKADDVETLKVNDIAKERGIALDDPGRAKILEAFRKENPLPLTTVKDVADHVMHVIKLVGAEHVGLGSDFDGVGDSLPVGLKNVSQYPSLFQELLARGVSESDIEKIASGNVLRVWAAVEVFAQKSAKK